MNPQALWIAAVVAYLSFPLLSGTWFYDRIDCIHMWSEAVKQGLSIAAYLSCGTFLWRKFRPEVISEDGATVLYGGSIFLGICISGNVIHKCW